jgi:O-antigen ligase
LAISCSAVTVAVVFGSVMNAVDFFGLGSLPLSIAPGRAAGLYQNPNISGNYLVLGMVIAMWVIPKRLRWWFCMGVGVGVFLTFSRASILMWGLAIVLLAWYRRFGLSRMVSIMTVIFLVAAVGLAMVSGQMTEILSGMGLGQHLTADTSARVTGNIFEQNDTSSTGRLFLLTKSVHWFLESPFFGHGIGQTFEWGFGASTHNMFLLYAVEMGVIGISVFSALIWILWSTNTSLGRTIAILFALSSLFTHNNLEHSAMMVVLAIAVSLSDREPRSEPKVWQLHERAFGV